MNKHNRCLPYPLEEGLITNPTTVKIDILGESLYAQERTLTCNIADDTAEKTLLLRLTNQPAGANIAEPIAVNHPEQSSG